jgi:hypothetical protein
MLLGGSQILHNPEVFLLVHSFLSKPIKVESDMFIFYVMFFHRLKEEYRALEEQNIILNNSLEAKMLQSDSESASSELSECRMQRDQIVRNVS